jgi:hypothetical protein
MLHPDVDTPGTLRSALMTVLATVIVLGGFVLLYTDSDTATVALPEPTPPAAVGDDGARAPVFSSGMAVLSADTR